MSFAPDAIVVLESVGVPGGVRYDERARFPLLPRSGESGAAGV